LGKIKMNRKLISKSELLIIVFILLAAGAYFIISSLASDGVYARISVRNYPDIYLVLSEDMDFILPQNPNVQFKVESGAIAFTASDCPDQVCVHMGFLHRTGQSAACLPNLVSLVLIGSIAEDAVDIFAH